MQKGLMDSPDSPVQMVSLGRLVLLGLLVSQDLRVLQALGELQALPVLLVFQVIQGFRDQPELLVPQAPLVH